MGGRRREEGRESRAITFLSPIGSGGKPQDVSRSLPESVVELLRGRAGRPFKAVAGAQAWTERSLPPPPRSPRAPQPEPPPSTIRSHSLRRPRASGYCFFSGSEGWKLRSASRVRALSRGRSWAGEAAAPGVGAQV